MASVSLNDLKSHLLLPLVPDEQNDPILSSLLLAATERASAILGQPADRVGASSVSVGIRFFAGWLWEHPYAKGEEMAGALNALTMILSPYRTYSYPDDEAKPDAPVPVGTFKSVTATIRVSEMIAIPVIWDVGFADNNYVVSYSVCDDSGQVTALNFSYLENGSGIEVRCFNQDPTAPHTIVIHAFAHRQSSEPAAPLAQATYTEDADVLPSVQYAEASGTITLNLCDPAACPGHEVTFLNKGDGKITIAAAQKVNDLPAYFLVERYQYVTLISVGTTWRVKGNN